LAHAHLYGLVICSNSALQLWPLSRERAPLELAPDASSGLSPLAKAIRAIAPHCATPLIIAVPGDMAPLVEQHIAKHTLLAPTDYAFLVEPYPRGTALTTALAAATVKLVDPHAVLVCLPANNAFDADDRWAQALARAVKAAQCDRIAVVGSSTPPLSRTPGFAGGAAGRMAGGILTGGALVRATDAWGTGRAVSAVGGAGRTGGAAREAEAQPALLGTIRMGAELKECEGAYLVRSFIARPAPAVAWRAEQNKSLWSTHIFVCKADIALGELRAAGRDADDPQKQTVQRIAETARFFVALGSEHWNSKEARELVETLPALSFEEAVFETTQLLAAIPTSIGFYDLTTLAGYEQSLEADVNGNRLRGNTLAVQTRDTTILADAGKLVVTLGIEDALVIDTPDATLITTHKALGSMPAVLATLKATSAPEL
jgi:mannose-1-phosphate guanylyltransferase/mannose-6-phosphate isomerase